MEIKDDDTRPMVEIVDDTTIKEVKHETKGN
jgi:hypothetical protein